MTKLTKRNLNAAGIHNSRDLATAAGNRILITKSRGPIGNSFSGWRVVGIRFKTDPEAAWYDHGCKTFNAWGREAQAIALSNAIAWVKDTYNLTVSERDVWGVWHVEGTLGKIEKYLQKEQ